MNEADFLAARALMASHRERVEWSSGCRPDLSGLARYVILVRAPEDPERRSRSARRGLETEVVSVSRSLSVDAWKERFRSRFADGRPRTFNAAMVEECDWTADCAPDRAVEAMWQLVEEEVLEHTMRSPIRFRLVDRDGPRSDSVPMEVI